MAASQDERPFKVLIAGGGIAGLAMANCLQLAGIDYQVLEARKEIGTFVGAAVVLSGALPTVEQLGLRPKLAALMEPIRGMGIHDVTGAYMEKLTDSLDVVKDRWEDNLHTTNDEADKQLRCGYYRGTTDRSDVINLFYDNIQNRDEKVLTGKKILSIAHTKEGVTAHCTDGSSYHGDILVGADGVHSVVKPEMWRIADEQQPGAIPESDRKDFMVHYKVLYGMCRKNVELEFRPGDFHFLFSKDLAFLYAPLRQGQLMIGAFEKLDRPRKKGELRFTDADADAMAESYMDKPLMPNGTTKFRDVWKHVDRRTLVATEEGVNDYVTFGRIAMVGDAVHKMTPSAGQGANLSINSATALCNVINRLVKQASSGKPSYDEITRAFKEDFELPRRQRCRKVTEICNLHTRIVAIDNLIFRGLIIAEGFKDPDNSFDLFHEIEIGAEMLDFVPVPSGVQRATMPYNKYFGLGSKQETFLRRALIGLPLLVLFCIAKYEMDGLATLPAVEKMIADGRITWATGSHRILDSVFGLKPLDDFSKLTTTVFAQWTFGYDGPGSWQAFHFLNDAAMVIAVFLIEGARRANKRSLFAAPAIGGMLFQALGAGLMLPLLLFWHYIRTPISTFLAADQRLTNLAYVRTVIPTILIGFFVPHVLANTSFLNGTPDQRYWWSWVWQPWPIWCSILQFVFSYAVEDTVKDDRLYALKRDLKWIRAAIGVFAVIGTASWWWTNLNAPYTLKELYVPGLVVPGAEDLVGVWRHFLQWDYLMVSAAGLTWLALLFRDLKRVELVKASWPTLVVAAVATTVVAGPGVTLGLGWLWREEALANGKMKGAITAESWRPAEEVVGEKVNGKVNGTVNGTAKA